MTRRYRVTVLTSSPLRCVRWIIDPTLPRDGTDLIATGVREVDPTLPRELITPGVVMRIVDVHNPFEYEGLLAGLIARLAPTFDHLWQQ